MTEIPEHLLQRSRERRAALGLGGDAPAAGSGGEAATPEPSAAAPVPAESGGGGVAKPPTPAPPAEPKPEPPKPDPIYVQAAKQRRRIPLWAMPVLAALPLWGYVFYGTLSPAPVENDPLALGEELYAPCAACHGPKGGGEGGAPALNEGAVESTWPDYRDHMMWVKLGQDGWPSDVYGANDTSKQANSNVMPGYAATMTDQEIAQVVLYERQVLSGQDPAEPELEELRLIAEGEMTWEEAKLGELSEKAGVPESELAG